MNVSGTGDLEDRFWLGASHLSGGRGALTCRCLSCHFLKAGTKVSAWKVSSVASSDPIRRFEPESTGRGSEGAGTGSRRGLPELSISDLEISGQAQWGPTLHGHSLPGGTL